MTKIRRHRIYLLILAGVWTVVTLMFLSGTIRAFQNARRAMTFASTKGTVTYIQEDLTGTPTDDPNSTQSTIEVRYRYFVDEEAYESTRLRYGSASGSHAWATEVVKEYPVDSRATVYYNAASPSEAVLLRGVDRADYLPLILLAPGVTVMVLLWGVVYQVMVRPARFAGLDVIEEEQVVRLRPARSMGLVWGAVVMVIASVVLAMGMVAAQGMHPSIPMASVLVITAILAGLGTMGMLLWQIKQGKRDLVLNLGEKKVMALRPKRVEIPLASIMNVHIAELEKYRIRGQPLLSVSIRYKHGDGIGAPERLVVKSYIFSPADADELALFVGKKLKVPAYSAANSKLVDPDAPVKAEPRTATAVRPVFTNPHAPVAGTAEEGASAAEGAAPAAKPTEKGEYKPFRPTHRRPRDGGST